MQYIHYYDSPLGKILLSAEYEKLTGLWFKDQKYFASTLDKEHEEKDLEIFDQTFRWLDEYFAGRQPDFMPEISLKTTEFRKKVFEALMKIPYGKTVTYKQIGNMICEKGKNISYRAIGSAISHNPISIIIPCHRVLGSDGSLTGYAGGLDRKEKLLKLEGVGR